ncbi:MAG: peptide deformylase, partial [Helicobacter apodemus]|nr:peptide deformylase [Helicobacter apodemus]
IEVINPEILEKSGEKFFREGCLSVPDFYADVKRFQKVKVAYQDRFGNPKEIEAQDYLAVVFQHEIDHLNGVLFIDKLSILKRKKFEKAFKQNKNCKAWV